MIYYKGPDRWKQILWWIDILNPRTLHRALQCSPAAPPKRGVCTLQAVVSCEYWTFKIIMLSAYMEFSIECNLCNIHCSLWYINCLTAPLGVLDFMRLYFSTQGKYLLIKKVPCWLKYYFFCFFLKQDMTTYISNRFLPSLRTAILCSEGYILAQKE